MQDVAGDGKGSIAFRREPLLKRFRRDMKIGEKFVSIQICCCLQIRALLRAGQSLELVEVDLHIPQLATGKPGYQMAGGGKPKRFAKLQEAIAQAVPRLLRTLVGPQQVGQPLAANGLATLRGKVSNKAARLFREFADPTNITCDH